MTSTVDPEERYYQERLKNLRREALPNTRSIAAKWSETVGTLLGLLGASVIIVSRDQISRLSSFAGIIAGTCLAMGIAMAMIAVVAAAIASQGRFRKIGPTGSATSIFTRETKDAQRLLFISRLTVASAMILLVTAVLVGWYGPAADGASNPAANVLVVADNAASCGKLSRISNSQLVLVDDNGAISATISLISIKVLTQVSTCPK